MTALRSAAIEAMDTWTSSVGYEHNAKAKHGLDALASSDDVRREMIEVAAKTLCSHNPPEQYPRYGGTLTCGCWNFKDAWPGKTVGGAGNCSIHGATTFVRMNVEEPDWTPKPYTPPPGADRPMRRLQGVRPRWCHRERERLRLRARLRRRGVRMTRRKAGRAGNRLLGRNTKGEATFADAAYVATCPHPLSDRAERDGVQWCWRCGLEGRFHQ